MFNDFFVKKSSIHNRHTDIIYQAKGVPPALSVTITTGYTNENASARFVRPGLFTPFSKVTRGYSEIDFGFKRSGIGLVLKPLLVLQTALSCGLDVLINVLSTLKACLNGDWDHAKKEAYDLVLNTALTCSFALSFLFHVTLSIASLITRTVATLVTAYNEYRTNAIDPNSAENLPLDAADMGSPR